MMNHPFKCYVMYDDQRSDNLLGGSYDNISAVTVACAVFSTLYQAGGHAANGVGVYDDTDTMIAYIGMYQPQSNPLSEDAPA